MFSSAKRPVGASLSVYGKRKTRIRRETLCLYGRRNPTFNKHCKRKQGDFPRNDRNHLSTTLQGDEKGDKGRLDRRACSSFCSKILSFFVFETPSRRSC